MNKILLAYDGTVEAEAALVVAAELGTKLVAEIGVVSVVLMHPGRIGGDPWMTPRSTRRSSIQARERLAAVGARPELHRATGDPATEIERTAAEHGYDMIVVGSRGLSTIGRLLQGSVSEHVATHARANVLAVRPPHPARGEGGDRP
jgi:nucleotide-binding universal stress UspA family protein